ncbi:MAG: ABC transporter ATP-binding protein [Bacteroidales bacterium]|nr:ABC transporter ATP-binding protein [Bacteroidales bacterium]MBD5230105.1 ABC transporter ATP-binding protein [Bacteroidales bacterium]
MDLVTVDHVSKQFVGHRALDDVSLAVPEGSIYGLLGPNGAGKTTLLRIINHITAPDQGAVYFAGHPLTQADVNSIGYLPEERGLYKKMKVGEQAMFFARLKGMSKRDASAKLHEWFDKFGISDWWNKKVEELSKGMAQKIQFIITVLHEPRLLIFDEPFSGFDPINAKLLKDEILQLRDKGATIIFSTHNMASVETLCDEITLINKSHNILTGNVNEIRRQFGADRYCFSFKGDEALLLNAFGDKVVSKLASLKDDEGDTRLTLRFTPGSNLHDLIATANDAVALKAFSADLPSMDEIFITSVENNNRKS